MDTYEADPGKHGAKDHPAVEVGAGRPGHARKFQHASGEDDRRG